MNDKPEGSEDPRLAQILEVICKFAAGDLSARGTVSDDDGALDGVMAGINFLGEKLEAQVAESKQALEYANTLIGSNPDGVLAVDRDLRITEWNPRMEQMCGKGRQQAIGLYLAEFPFMKETGEGARIREGLEGRSFGPREVAYRFPGEDTDRNIESVMAPLRGPAGEFRGIVLRMHDITERKQAEEDILKLNLALEEKVKQLLESEEELEQHRAHLEQTVAQRTANLTEAQRIAHLGNWEWDLINNTLNWSDEMYRIFGYAPQQIAASYEDFLNAVHPEDRRLVEDSVREALARQHTYSVEHRIMQPDGTLRYVHGQAEVMHGEDGQPISLLGTLHDITESKLATQALAASEFRFRTILDAAVDGIAVMDAQLHRLIMGNRAFGDMLGYRQDELPSLGFEDLHPKEALAEVQKQFDRQLKGELQVARDLPVKRKDGSVFFADISASLMDYAGRPALLGIFHDVTERKLAEQTAVDERNFSSTLIARLPDAFYVLDATGLIIRWNKKLNEILGLSDTQMAVTNALAVIHEAERPSVAQKIQEAFEQGAASIDARVITKTGIREYVFNAASVDTALGKYLVGVGTDITERKQMEGVLRDSEEKFRSISANGQDAIIMMDNDRKISYWNAAAEKIFGYSAEEIMGKDLHQLLAPARFHKAFSEGYDHFKNTGEGPAIGKTLERTGLRKGGEEFPLELSLSAALLGNQWNAIGLVRDITERKLAEAEVQKLQEQLREQALHDPLTGLYNRRYLDVTVDRELVRATRNNQPIGILMCDLDHFKRVNDTHGHLAGDEVLQVFAALLKKHARSSDIVCRFGGEEFVMFLPDMSPAAAYQRAEQLRTELAAKRITLGAAVMQVTASFGVAGFPENGKTMDSLIRAVDAAMYQAKEAGRNRVVVSSMRAAGGPALA